MNAETEKKTVNIGTVKLAGYSGVSEEHPPKLKTIYGFVGPDFTVWAWQPRLVGMAAINAPHHELKYSVTVEVPHLMAGQLAEKFSHIEAECEKLRKTATV